MTLPFTSDTPATPTGAKGLTCKRHTWFRAIGGNDCCSRCFKTRDVAKSRQGKRSRDRGLAIQREACREQGIANIPGNGPRDGESPLFVASVKSGPSYYSVRVENELDGLPLRAGQTAIFIAASTPGPGRKREFYTQLSLGDLSRLVGEHAQVAIRTRDLRLLTDGQS